MCETKRTHECCIAKDQGNGKNIETRHKTRQYNGQVKHMNDITKDLGNDNTKYNGQINVKRGKNGPDGEARP